jgi:hypothetical protein
VIVLGGVIKMRDDEPVSFEVVVEVTVSVTAYSEEEATALAEDWCGLAQGYPQDKMGFVCANVQQVN